MPTKVEIKKCSKWLDYEINTLKPKLIIPVGKLAISQFIIFDKLNDVVGKKIIYKKDSYKINIVALPHPSGLSTWYKKEPGKSLLYQALKIIKNEKEWKLILEK